MNHSLDDVAVFIKVAQEGSFTRAAAVLGVSASAVSQTVRSIEERLGVRLLTRTTRSVKPTEAGEKLLQDIAPLLHQISDHISAVTQLKDRPSGTVRITADEFAVRYILWPRLQPLLDNYPELTIELMTDYGLTDIAAEQFDAGVRLGGVVAEDMIAMPLTEVMRLAVVASPLYFEKYGYPEQPEELTSHRCINLRLPTHGGLFAWEFSKGNKEFRVRVKGPLIMNSSLQILEACISGAGMAQMPEVLVRPYIERGELQEVLSDWSEPFDGYHLYYASRQQTAAFRVVLDALRQTV